MNQHDTDSQAPVGSSKGDAWQAAIDFGIDMSQVEYLLSLTPHERLIRHNQALELVRALREAGKKHYGFDPRHPPDPCGP